MRWRTWRCLSRKKLDFLKASCNDAIAGAFIVSMIVFGSICHCDLGIGVAPDWWCPYPRKDTVQGLLGRAPVCRCRWWSKQTVSRVVWGCYHLAQFFHQYPSVTQRCCIPHDISQVQSRLMDLFSRLDKCIPRTRKSRTSPITCARDSFSDCTTNSPARLEYICPQLRHLLAEGWLIEAISSYCGIQ
jgi:hypothetical protein